MSVRVNDRMKTNWMWVCGLGAILLAGGVLMGDPAPAVAATHKQKTVRFFWRVQNFSCVCGGGLTLSVNGKAVKKITRAGKVRVKKGIKLIAGRRYTLSAVDACQAWQSGPQKIKIPKKAKRYTWTSNCPADPVKPVSGTWSDKDENNGFLVSADGSVVEGFYVTFFVGGCGDYRMTVKKSHEIRNGKFSSDQGSFYLTGTFLSNTVAQGTYGFRGYEITYCSHKITGGPFAWTAAPTN